MPPQQVDKPAEIAVPAVGDHHGHAAQVLGGKQDRVGHAVRDVEGGGRGGAGGGVAGGGGQGCSVGEVGRDLWAVRGRWGQVGGVRGPES